MITKRGPDDWYATVPTVGDLGPFRTRSREFLTQKC